VGELKVDCDFILEKKEGGALLPDRRSVGPAREIWPAGAG
jgi:hypothetical protein